MLNDSATIKEAKEQKMRELIKQKLGLSIEISDCGKSEQESLIGYYRLLDRLTPYFEEEKDELLEEFKKDIEEIISDELNHIAKLQKWAIKLGGVKENKN